MRSTLKPMALAGALAIGGLAMIDVPAQAGCGGGGYRSTGGYGGGYTFNSGYYGARGGGGCGGGCGMSGMSMPGMSMPGMNMGAYASSPAPGNAPAAYPQPAPQPAVAGAQYTCPMHPTVASATPGSCPYCHMALQRR
jgi:hypothetical protein